MTIEELKRDITDYNKMRPHIMATLRNADWDAKIYIRADRYGFPGMIIEPKIFLGVIEDSQASVVINEQILKVWNVSKPQLISDAIENLQPVISPMWGLLEEMAELVNIEELGDISVPPIPMYVVSNKERWYGAAAILKAKNELREMFPDGYIIIPSSIHETIVVPGTEADIGPVSEIVRAVNSSNLEPWEVLGHRAYMAA